MTAIKQRLFDRKKLQVIEREFLAHYPKGFDDPGLEKVRKSHRMDKMTEFASQAFNKKACRDIEQTVANMIKIVSRSSMVSMFEKPKFRDFINGLNLNDQAFLVNSLKQLLHGKQALGFEALVDILTTEKLAKWSLVTIIPAYYSPQHEVFVKPTTAKGVIKHFELEGVEYKPLPSWEFYERYRDLILEMRSQVDPSLAPNNAAFCGFLMMSLER